MTLPFQILALLALCPLALRAAPPAALAMALEHLRDQKSYSWEVINADPGPVAQQFETRRGTVTSVQQSTAPNVKGQLDRTGDMLIRREWADGLRLDTIIAASGATVTNTPEGWLSEREILAAQAEERVQNQTTTPRAVWLRRADRPDLRRPDQELVPFLKSTGQFEIAGDRYTIFLSNRKGNPADPDAGEADRAVNVTLTMNLRGGVIRDYEVKIETTRRSAGSRISIPISEQRIVVLNYLPVTRIDIPAEARAKLTTARPPGGRTP